MRAVSDFDFQFRVTLLHNWKTYTSEQVKYWLQKWLILELFVKIAIIEISISTFSTNTPIQFCSTTWSTISKLQTCPNYTSHVCHKRYCFPNSDGQIQWRIPSSLSPHPATLSLVLQFPPTVHTLHSRIQRRLI